MTRLLRDGSMRIRWRNMVADRPASGPLRVLLDTNVVLDRILQRQPWFDQAADFWRARSAGLLVAYVATSTLTDIFYIGRRIVGSADALAGVDACLREGEEQGVFREDRNRCRIWHCGIDARVSDQAYDQSRYLPNRALQPGGRALANQIGASTTTGLEFIMCHRYL